MTYQSDFSIFTPSRSKPEDLEAIFVQRKDILIDTLERVRESANTANKHHLLFVGPRGTGKTHLMTLLVYRLSLDKELDNKLRIAWLNEDETSTTLLEFLIRIFLALNKRYSSEYKQELIEPIYDLSLDEAEQKLISLLLKKLQKSCLLVVVENLDAVFQGLGKMGQQKLRALIQEHPVFSIVATAQRLVDDISKRKSAFFGFFQTEYLKTLSVDQAAELISKIAIHNKQPDVASFIDTATGRSRIRALHHLSGGNHRIYIVLSQFINSKTINALVEPFAKMIDEMTPYYQERIRWLPPQQRKIVEYLCSCVRPATVKQISRRLFASNQTISSQLKGLREKGYVQSAQRGRESLYEIAEPLMRICVEIKENQSDAPLTILVDFLRVWYDTEELSSLLGGYDSLSLECTYLELAINKNHNQGNLRSKLLVDGFCTELGPDKAKQWRSNIEYYANICDELGLAFGTLAKGEEQKALSILFEITQANSSTSNLIKSETLMLMADIYYKNRSFNKAINCLDSILELSKISVKMVAHALHNRATIYGMQGKTEQALMDYCNLFELNGAPKKFVFEALYNRAVAYGKQGKIKQAKKDYNTLIKLEGTPIKLVAKALYNRAITLGQEGQIEQAIIDCNTLIHLNGAPMEQVSNALHFRGITFFYQDKFNAAENDLKGILQLADVPIQIQFDSYLALAIIYIGTGRWDDAVPMLTKALKEIDNKSSFFDLGSKEIISAFFESNLTAEKCHERIKILAQIYIKNKATTLLGEALIQHLGRLFLIEDALPTPETFELWGRSWENALKNTDALLLPLRIFRTGIDFLKTGGADRNILLNLHQEERKFLEQALQLKELK
ncbi:MAG: tetratricopeptide repeat protein [Pseudomonadota bacterium]